MYTFVAKILPEESGPIDSKKWYIVSMDDNGFNVVPLDSPDRKIFDSQRQAEEAPLLDRVIGKGVEIC